MVPFQMVAGFTEASNGAAAISIAAPSAIIPAGCFFQMVMASVRDTTDNLIIPCRVQLESRNPNSPGLKVYWASVAAKDYQVEAYGYIHRIA